jgi:multiple sugar transport system ATP-binding protein
MRRGELQQVAPPQELYDRPVNLFVGGFIGSPAMNLMEATLERADGGLAAVLGSQKIRLDDDCVTTRSGLKEYEGRQVVIGIRPEQLEDAEIAREAPEDRRLRGEVELREALGAELMVHFTIDAAPAMTEDVQELAADAGTTAAELGGGDERRTVVVGRFGPDSKVQENTTAEVAVDTRALHFFDTETGRAIYDEPDTKGATG